MYERSYGYKYSETDSGHAPDIAKLIRADIKQAVSEGLLPGKPVTYSVTSESYSGGQSIDVTVKGWAEAWQDCDGIVPGTKRTYPDGCSVATACPNQWCAANNDSPHATPHQVLTEEARTAEMTLDRIHGAYNHDGSEIQTDYFDVRYYGGVKFEDARSAAFHAEEKARLVARRAAIDSATDVRRVRVYGRGGASNVHDAAEVDGKLRLLCGATLWSRSSVGFATGELTCSRCAKRASRS